MNRTEKCHSCPYRILLRFLYLHAKRKFWKFSPLFIFLYRLQPSCEICVIACYANVTRTYMSITSRAWMEFAIDKPIDRVSRARTRCTRRETGARTTIGREFTLSRNTSNLHFNLYGNCKITLLSDQLATDYRRYVKSRISLGRPRTATTIR